MLGKHEAEASLLGRLELELNQLSAELDRQRLEHEAALQALADLLRYAKWLKNQTEG